VTLIEKRNGNVARDYKPGVNRLGQLVL